MSVSHGDQSRLHLLRHADAGDPERWSGPDEARPLSDKGRGQAERLGAFLAACGFKTDVIVTSPKVRARQTAEIVATALRRKVLLEERLAGSLSVSALSELLAELDATSSVLVGHDPDLSDLLADLTGAEALEMKKGAMARLDLELPLRPGAARLRWLVPPDLLTPQTRL